MDVPYVDELLWYKYSDIIAVHQVCGYVLSIINLFFQSEKFIDT